MLVLKKIGAALVVAGVAGLIAPWLGLVFKGLRPGETRMAGVFLMFLGVGVLGIGFALEKLQDWLERRANEKARPKMKVPDDVIR